MVRDTATTTIGALEGDSSGEVAYQVEAPEATELVEEPSGNDVVTGGGINQEIN